MQMGNMGHKVGVKILSDRQLENVLPTYQNLLNKIETCRNVAEHRSMDIDNWNYQYNYMYDNVFSILGQRGTGKTSVAFTLQRKLQDRAKSDRNGDVILPLIIPEVIPENCSILGWLLAIVKDRIELLDECVKSTGRANGLQIGEWEPCRYMQGKNLSLRERLDQIYKAFFSKNYNPSNENSYYRSVENSVLQAHGFYEVSKKIAELWDEWVRAIKFVTENGKEQTEGAQRKITPMIYFIFDDVDLAPEKIGEMLSVIVKYLSHPNIIVLTTADERMFLEVVENRLDRSVGRLPREWRYYLKNGKNYIYWYPDENDEQKENEQTEYDKRDIVSITARMYLGKVLPASTRYYLRRFHAARDKAEFYLEEESRLGETIVAQIDTLTKCIKAENEDMNFMKKGEEQIYYYLRFMGDTSRQIWNAFIALMELLSNIQDIIAKANSEESLNKERMLEKIFQHIRYFLCTAINTNHQLSEVLGDVEHFVDEVFLAEYNHWRLYCDYAYLDEFLRHRLKGKAKAEQLEIGQQVYTMLAFIESLLLLLEHCLPEGITGRRRIYTTRFWAAFIQDTALNGRTVFRDDLDGKEFVWQYGRILDRLGEIINYESSEQKFDLEYFHHFRDMGGALSPQEFFYMNRDNHKWFMEMVKMVTRVYGNVYVIEMEDMSGCFPRYVGNSLTGYQKQIREDFHENMKGILGKVRMHEEINSYQIYFDQIIESAKRVLNDAEKNQSSTKGKAYPDAFVNFVNELKGKYTNGGASGSAISKGNIKYIRLTSIIKDIVQRMQGKENVREQDVEGWNRFWQMCPAVFLSVILPKGKDDIGEICSNATETKEMLSRCMNQVESLNNLGKKAFLSNPHEVEERLSGLAQGETPYRRKLRMVLDEIAESTKKKGDNGGVAKELIIDKALYRDMIALCNMLPQMEKMGEGMVDKDTGWLWEMGEELMGYMDIAIDINNTEEFRRVVLGGMYIIWTKVLQGLYVYQLVSERYSRGTNTSSKPLEKNKDGDSYYYQMFKFIEICLEGNAKESGKQQIMWYLGDEILKRDVSSAYVDGRRQYVNKLMDGVENGTV